MLYVYIIANMFLKKKNGTGTYTKIAREKNSKYVMAGDMQFLLPLVVGDLLNEHLYL